MEVTLSYPPRALWPNARPHWGTKQRAVRTYRHEAKILAMAAGARDFAAERVSVAVTVHPPTRNTPDADNALAALKGAIDGIADALRIDDSRFDFAAPVIGEPIKGGRVIVEIGGEG